MSNKLEVFFECSIAGNMTDITSDRSKQFSRQYKIMQYIVYF